MKISTCNVNGVRAAARKGLADWLATEAPDVLLLQEVRAEPEITEGILGPQWELFSEPSRIKGRAGVAIAVRRGEFSIVDVRHGLDDQESEADSGRWIEATVNSGDESCRLVSAYFHSGEKGTVRQDAKMAHMPRIATRMGELLSEGGKTLVCGDFNIVRSKSDIKNWTPNHNKRAGVLDEEIAFLEEWLDAGWHDVVRELAGEVQGPYSWWSQRGKAFDNDTGWRIDYHFATPAMASAAKDFVIGRAPSYDSRFSDHAPVTVSYSF